jgi:hypothetical protein
MKEGKRETLLHQAVSNELATIVEELINNKLMKEVTSSATAFGLMAGVLFEQAAVATACSLVMQGHVDIEAVLNDIRNQVPENIRKCVNSRKFVETVVGSRNGKLN